MALVLPVVETFTDNEIVSSASTKLSLKILSVTELLGVVEPEANVTELLISSKSSFSVAVPVLTKLAVAEALPAIGIARSIVIS